MAGHVGRSRCDRDYEGTLESQILGGSDGGPFDHAPHGAARGEPGRKPPPAKTFSLSEKDYAWIDSKLTQQPNGLAMQAIKLTGKRDAIAKKTYIRAPKYPQAAFDKALADCNAGGGWQTFVNDNSGHDVMIDQPAWLADLLLKVS